MRRGHWATLVGGLILSCLIAAPALAQEGPPARIKLRTAEITVNPDGTSTAVHHDEIEILSQAAINSLSQQPVQFEARTQTIAMGEAYTQKANGTKIPVSPDTILTQAAPSTGAQLAPVYTDLQRKIIIYPNVQIGDTLVSNYTITTNTPHFPGHFARAVVFPPGAVIGEQRIVYRVPRSMPLTTEMRNAQMTKSEDGNQLVYTFTFSRNAPMPPFPPASAAVTELRQQDRVFVSSFTSYDQLAREYARLALPKIMVTPAIQAKADELTKDLTDKRAIVRALYEWVNLRVRYVSIALGTGGIVPHESEWTLTNAYGDCKDKAVLLSALLKAKGIDSVPVLIYALPQYELVATPSVGQFNHMITYVPDLKMYLDSTAPGTPFAELPVGDYGKPVVHVVASGPARFTTPLVPAGLLTSTYKANAKIDEEGRVTVTGSATTSGPWAILWRTLASQMTQGASVRVADQLIRQKNMAQATGDFTMPPPDGTGPYTIGSSLLTQKLQPQTNLMPALTVLRTPSPVGDGLIGPLTNTTLKPTDSTACYSGHQVEEISVEIPAGKTLAKLPDNVSIRESAFTYESKWTQDGQSVSVRREFISNVKDPVCTGALRQSAASALAKIRADQDQPLMLAN